jgi:hypothetical protein
MHSTRYVTILVTFLLLLPASGAWSLGLSALHLDDNASTIESTGSHWFDQAVHKRLSAKPARPSTGVLSLLSLDVSPYIVPSGVQGSRDEYLWFGAQTRLQPFPLFSLNADMAYGTSAGDGRDPSTTALSVGLELDLKLFTPEVFMLYQGGSDVQHPLAGPGLVSNPVLASALSLELLPREMVLAPMQGVGFRLKNFAISDNLTNYLSVVYATGLVDSPMLGSSFGPDDALLGVSMDAQYALFEQLAAMIEIGVLKLYPAAQGEDPNADWKLSLGFKYDF